MASPAPRRALASALLARHPITSAAALEAVPEAEVAAVLGAEAPVTAARVLERVVPSRAAAVLVALGDTAPPVLAEMAAPVAARAVAWLPDDQREVLLGRLGAGLARELRDLLGYPPNTAGSLMDPRVRVVRRGETVERALERIAGARIALFQILAVDEEHRLVGAVPIHELALAKPEQTIDALIAPTVSVDAFTHRDEVAEMLAATATPAIAVLDAEGHLVGVLRHRSLLGIAEEDAANRIQQMVGVSRDERALSRVSFAVRKRLPWLNINLLTAFLAAAVVGLFEGTIARVTSLAVLLPVVAGQSGNSGSQALAVTMRGLALREIRAAHWPRVAAKELMVGITNGVAIAVVTAAGVVVWSGSPALAGVIAVAMVVSMACAGLAGASVPIVLKRLGQDPAQSSSIILTTVTDVVGFSSFLGLATLLVDYLV